MKKKFRAHKIFMIVVVVLFLIIGILSTALTSFNDKEYTITVTDKERVENEDSSKYLIFGDSRIEEGLVFENTDVLLRGKFNSSNIYSKLKVGNTYEITVVGYRIPFMSCYENIIKVKEVVK